jgi:multiple sugar transport system substrate-binding protein
MTQSLLTPSQLSRRSLLRGAAVGAGVVTVPGLLAACGGGGSSGSSGGGSKTQTITFGSNYSDKTPKEALASMVDVYQKKSGNTVKINTVSHNDYQTNITRYLQANPDDVAAWFAGYRMQFFAQKGYLEDISDVWSGFSGFSDALKAASTGADGKQYFVPLYNYAWALFYRKSLFQSKGYQPPKTWDEYVALAKKMKADGLTPIGFADKDGWPAMGTFDYINMRKNGYQFHVDLMAGKQSWTDQKVKDVFGLWASLFDQGLYQPGSLGRTWEEAGTSFAKKEVGMIVFGVPHVALQTPKEEHDDIGIVPFPIIDESNATDSIEAPIDGFMLPKKAKNVAGGKDLLKWIGTPEAENAYLKVDNSNIAVNSGADTSGYEKLQKDSSALVAAAKHVSQYLDRDTRPDFAQTVVITSFQSFIDKHSKSDIDALCASMEDQKKSIFSQPVS